MAVPEQTPYIEHTGNGVTTSFALKFQCESKDHLIVLVDEIEPPIATWNLSEGNVVFTTAPAAGKKIILQRNTPFSRTTDYQSFNNSFRPQSVNGDFDRVWRKLQELGVADWILSIRINDLRAYVERQDSVLQENIDNLKTYVDDRDDELRAYLMEEIRKQGVALDQLDEYYNYLMQQLAQIAVNRGWDASFIADAGGSNQQQINDRTGNQWYEKPLGYELNARVMLGNGDIVKSTVANNIANPNNDMTGWVKVNATTQIFDETFGVFQSLLNKNIITVDNFGAKGDGVTDDSAAFQAYCDSALTGQNLHLGAKGRYVIKGQVDLKEKGVIGNGCGRIRELYYDLGCIDVDGSSPALAGKSAFLNCGPLIQNLTARCSNGAGKQVSFIEIDGFLANIQNITLVNFYNQIVVKEALVGFYLKNAWMYYPQNAGLYCADPLNRTSTTGYFDSIYFQLGDGYSMIFDRDIHGCDFKNIIFESMNGGIKARAIANCSFDNFWCENTKDGQNHLWLESTATAAGSNSVYGNYFGYIKRLGGWTSKTDPKNIPTATDNFGGTSISSGSIGLGLAGSKAKISLDPTGIYTTSQLKESQLDPSVVTPLVKQRMIGADGAGAQYHATDMYTKTMRKFNTYNHGSGSAGQFVVPMLLTYDQSFTTQQDNAGWTIVKESVGVYRVDRKPGNVGAITNPNITVGAPIMGSRKGNGSGATPGIQMIDTFAGSFNDYTEAAGFRIFWRDATGALVDPWRFTVSFTLGSGF